RNHDLRAADVPRRRDTTLQSAPFRGRRSRQRERAPIASGAALLRQSGRKVSVGYSDRSLRRSLRFSIAVNDTLHGLQLRLVSRGYVVAFDLGVERGGFETQEFGGPDLTAGGTSKGRPDEVNFKLPHFIRVARAALEIHRARHRQ